MSVQDSFFYESGESNSNRSVAQFGAKYDLFLDWGDISLFVLEHYDRQSPIFGNKDYVADPTGTLCGLFESIDGR